ncbi:glycosyltransferase family 4 protein [Candidatus Woesearchaeota archaeon]|nr:glycosyltransferase family 4 protein [Candidatus Woesearchaeota archaeon]
MTNVFHVLMKIVHLMGYFVPELGYQEYYLAKKHKEVGHDVYVITSDMLYPFPNIENMLKEAGIKDTSRKRKPGFSVVDGIKVYRLPHIIEYSDFILVKDLKKTLEKIRPDVVFAHESRQATPALAALYKKKLGYRLVVDQHDFYHRIPSHTLWRKAARFLDYFIFRKPIVDYSLRRADSIIAVTSETKDFLVKTHEISPKKILLIPLGVDTGFFKFSGKARQNIRKKFKISQSEIVLVFSGIVVRRKGIEILLEALSEISNENIKLLIVGSGDIDYMKELKDLSKKLGIGDNTIFTGFVKKNEIKNYFSAADIGIWPGNNSVSIMEAMACRLPIVMVDLQLSHLVSYGNGLKFPQHDKEKLKEALKKLVQNSKLRQDMSKNSVSAIKKHYSYGIIAEQFLKAAR